MLKFWQFNLTADECMCFVKQTLNLKIEHLHKQNNFSLRKVPYYDKTANSRIKILIQRTIDMK